MQHYIFQLKVFFKRLLALLFIYTLCRFIFFCYNYSFFAPTGLTEIVKSFLAGLKFDASILTTTNALFILLSILPVTSWNKRWYQTLLKTIFLVVNIVCVFLNCMDFVYFKFILKRTTADWFNMLRLGNDTQNLAFRVIFDFWHAILIFAAIVFLLVYLYNKVRWKKIVNSTYNASYSAKCWLLLLPLAALLIVFGRGGIGYKPLRILSASEYSVATNTPLILNTPFTILKTLGKSGVENIMYFTESEREKYFTNKHNFKTKQAFRPLNVVVIILESFSKEYIGSLNNYEGYTPFLDSLIHESLVFTNGYANAKKSIDGIPAVTAGIPALMQEPFITSAYSGNRLSSLASELKKKNYTTAFFHGGNNGTMGFDNFAKAAGFDFYKGKKEYGNKDYDGNWGVYDEPFYKFFLSEMTKMKQPFMTCMFSLSSHHPYSIPPQYNGKFKQGPLPIHESIGYADYALKTFFKSVSTEPWFDNTLFVITADHTGPGEFLYYKNKLGIFEIPILFYQHNSALKGKSATVTQQIDIFPSVLDYLNFDESFTAFGNSVFDSTGNHFAVNYLNEEYQLVKKNYLLQFDGESATALYNDETDSLLQHNLLMQQPLVAKENTLLIKAIVQQFNRAMIQNELAGQ